MKHTEGEWEISKHATPDYAPQYGIHNSGSGDFCIVRGENAEAIARLIAAAPDLLAALKGDEEDCMPNAQTILSQALLGNYDAVKTMLRETCSIHRQAIAKATLKG